jgi:hypothetical protein
VCGGKDGKCRQSDNKRQLLTAGNTRRATELATVQRPNGRQPPLWRICHFGGSKGAGRCKKTKVASAAMIAKSYQLRVSRKQIGGDGGDGDTPFFCPFAFTQQRSYKDSLAQMEIKKRNICANICVVFSKRSAKKLSAFSGQLKD